MREISDNKENQINQKQKQNKRQKKQPTPTKQNHHDSDALWTGFGEVRFFTPSAPFTN